MVADSALIPGLRDDSRGSDFDFLFESDRCSTFGSDGSDVTEIMIRDD